MDLTVSPSGKKEKWLLAGMLIAAFLVMFILSALTPLVADDYAYSFSMSTGGRVDSFYEIGKSMAMHRQNLNGRYFSHVFAMFFLWQDKLFFDLANALMAAVLVLAVYRMIRLVDSSRALLFTSIWCMLLFCLIPVFGQVFLWLDGSCNYSWGLTWNCLFLYPFLAFWMDAPQRRSWLSAPFYLLVAFIAGAYNETTSLSFLCLAFLILLIRTLQKRKPDLFLILLFLAHFGGFLFLFLAPGTSNHVSTLSPAAVLGKLFARASALPTLLLAGIPAGVVLLAMLFVSLRKKPKTLMCLFLSMLALSVTVLGFLTRPREIGHSVFEAVSAVLSSSPWGLLLITALYFSVFAAALYRKADRRVLLLSAMLGLSAAAPCAALLFAPYIPMRQFITYSALLTFAAVLMLASLSPSENTRLVRVLYGLLLVLVALHAVCGFCDILAVKRVSDERLVLIQEAKQTEEQLALIPMWYPRTKYSAAYGLDDVKDYPQSWPNTTMRDYYGVSNIIGYP